MAGNWGFAKLWRTAYARSLRGLSRARTAPELKCVTRTLLCPVDLWRYVEFSALLNAYAGETPVLDAGSPKMAAPLLIRANCKEIHATDIAWTPLSEFRPFISATETGNIVRVQADACALPYATGSFNFVFSISAIEHIGGNGDTVAMAEMSRVLKDGGRVLLTVPVTPVYREQWVDEDPYGKQVRGEGGKVFFSRYYDERALHGRIIEPSGLQVVSIKIWQERKEGWYARYTRATARGASVRSIITKFFDPWWAATKISAAKANDPPRHGIAAILLEKR